MTALQKYKLMKIIFISMSYAFGKYSAENCTLGRQNLKQIADL